VNTALAQNQIAMAQWMLPALCEPPCYAAGPLPWPGHFPWNAPGAGEFPLPVCPLPVFAGSYAEHSPPAHPLMQLDAYLLLIVPVPRVPPASGSPPTDFCSVGMAAPPAAAVFGKVDTHTFAASTSHEKDEQDSIRLPICQLEGRSRKQRWSPSLKTSDLAERFLSTTRRAQEIVDEAAATLSGDAARVPFVVAALAPWCRPKPEVATDATSNSARNAALAARARLQAFMQDNAAALSACDAAVGGPLVSAAASGSKATSLTSSTTAPTLQPSAVSADTAAACSKLHRAAMSC